MIQLINAQKPLQQCSAAVGRGVKSLFTPATGAGKRRRQRETPRCSRKRRQAGLASENFLGCSQAWEWDGELVPKTAAASLLPAAAMLRLWIREILRDIR